MKASIFVLAGALAMAGCGGGGLAGGNASASLTVSPASAPYGSQVNVAWGSNRAIRVEGSNFGLDDSDTSGSIMDNPGVDTTYQFTVRVQNDGHDPFNITKSATATVAKSTKSILVIGDTSVSGPNQVKDSLQTITSASVDIRPSIPASMSQGLAVIHPSANLSASDKAKVDALLVAGKAIVFIGESVVDVSGGNVSSMGGILAGATTYHTTNAQYATFRNTGGFVPLSVCSRGVRLTATGADGLTGISNSADRILTNSAGNVTSALAYKVPSGGRTGFVTEDGVGSTAHAQGYSLALRVIARWCLDGS